MNAKYFKKFLAMTLVFAMVLLSIPMGGLTFAVTQEEYTVEFKIPARAEITIDYLNSAKPNIVVEGSDTIYVTELKGTKVEVSFEDTGTGMSFEDVKVRYDETGNTTYIKDGPITFMFGEDFDGDDTIIVYVTSWKTVLSKDNTLLEVGVITEETFNSDVYKYTVLVESLGNKPDFGLFPVDPVGPVKNNEFATIEIIETQALTTVVVTAENGDVENYYFNFIVRAKPVIELIDDNPLVFNDTSGDTYTDAGATAKNADNDSLTPVMTGEETVMLDTPAIYYVNFNATDTVLVYRGIDRVYMDADSETRIVIVYEYVYVTGIKPYPDMLVYYGTDNPPVPTHATVTLDDTTIIQVPVVFNNGDPILNLIAPELFPGELQMPSGLNNPNLLTADQQINIKNYEIIEDTTIDPIEIYYDDPMPDLPTEALAQLDNSRTEMLDVQWDAGTVTLDQGDIGFNGVKKVLFVGEFDLEDGIDNTDAYKAFMEVHIQYYNVVLVVNPGINYEYGGTPYGEVFAALDTSVTVNLDVGLPRIMNITLEDLSGTYDTYANSIFHGELQLPLGVLNPSDLMSAQEVHITELMIVDAYDPDPQHVPSGTMLDAIVPGTVIAILNNDDEIVVDVDFGTDYAIISDVNVIGNIVNLPDHIGIEEGVNVTQVITVQKVIIVENPESEIESDGIVLNIGYNRTPEEGFQQLYYELVPMLEQSHSAEWSVVSGETLISLDEFGLVTGLNPGNAVVRVTVSYNHYNQLTSEDVLVYQDMIHDDIPVQVIRHYPPTPPNDPPTRTPRVSIRLDKDPVELEYGSDALEELLAYDLTETIVNSSSKAVTWTIGDEEVATVDQNGVVTAVRQGETTVKVKHNASGKTATSDVIVFLVGDEPNPLGEITFNQPYVYGYPDVTFRPKNRVTRAEVATMFAKILDLQIVRPGGQIFEDVKPDKWYYNYVQAIRKTGIFVGDASGNFRPDEPMTRAEIATVFAKYWQYLETPVNSKSVDIADVDSAHWASAYIYMMYNAGIVTGYEDGTYKPNDLTLREQVVGMINTLIARPPFEAESSKFVDIDNTHWAYGNIEAASQIYLGSNPIFNE